MLQRVKEGFLQEDTSGEMSIIALTPIFSHFSDPVKNVRMTSGFGSLLLSNLASFLDFVRVRASTKPLFGVYIPKVDA